MARSPGTAPVAPLPADWVRFAHRRIRLHEVAWGCTRLHGVARTYVVRCALPLAASRIDAYWSAKPQAGRRAKTRAPSTTPQSCAIWTTIAHDRALFPRKTRQKIPDSRKDPLKNPCVPRDLAL